MLTEERSGVPGNKTPLASMKITNPIYDQLLKLKIINKKNIVKISNQVRDKKISVYKDQKTNVFFLEKYVKNVEYYKAIIPKNDINLLSWYHNKDLKKNPTTKPKSNNRNIAKKRKRVIASIKTLTSNINAPLLEDDIRRVAQFQKIVNNKNVLDFGCGWGIFLSKLKNVKSVSGIELMDERFDYIKKLLFQKV